MNRSRRWCSLLSTFSGLLSMAGRPAAHPRPLSPVPGGEWRIVCFCTLRKTLMAPLAPERGEGSGVRGQTPLKARVCSHGGARSRGDLSDNHSALKCRCRPQRPAPGRLLSIGQAPDEQQPRSKERGVQCCRCGGLRCLFADAAGFGLRRCRFRPVRPSRSRGDRIGCRCGHFPGGGALKWVCCGSVGCGC
jgi:hypothetical protein